MANILKKENLQVQLPYVKEVRNYASQVSEATDNSILNKIFLLCFIENKQKLLHIIN
jgi:hypothetical protein